jgi:hypothetical protein
MSGHDPYFVRRGWVDEEGHVRVIESSLKIMNSMDGVHGKDFYDEEAIEDDSATGIYTYPAPRDHANNSVYTSGYYYLGGMIELIDLMPSSPIEEATPSPLTADGGPEDGELNPFATVTTSQPNLHFHLPAPLADNPYALGQTSNVYNKSLPYAIPHTNEQNGLQPQSRSIAPRPNITIRHDLASTYAASYTTSYLRASLPTAPAHVMAPTVQPYTGFVPPVPNMSSLPTAGLHNAAPPVMTYTSFVPPGQNMVSLPNAGFHNAAPPVLPHARFAPPAATMTSQPTAASHNTAPPVLPHTGYAPLAPNTTYPYRPNNGPTQWPGAPILTLPIGSRAGQPVPAELHSIIYAIRNLKLIANTEHPERKVLKKPYEGSYQNASRDRQLIRDHFASGSGLLKNDSPLKEWYGDLRVFSEKMWEFLAVQKARVNRI